MIWAAFLSEAATETATASSTGTGGGGYCPAAVEEGYPGGSLPLYYLALLCEIATVMDRLVAPVYLLLTLVAILSLVSSFCRSLSLHGKLSVDDSRGNGHAQRSRIESSSSTGDRGVRDADGSALGARVGGVSAIADAILHGSAMRVRKRRFEHFYVLGVAGSAGALLLRLSSLSPTAVTVLNNALTCDSNQQAPSAVATSAASHALLGAAPLVLLLSHVCRRLYECRRVHEWRDDSTMHLAGYVVGMVHYLFLPLVFLDFGSNQDDRDVVGDDDSETAALPLGDLLRICACATLCLWSQAVQHRHHVLLADLRRRSHRPIPGGKTKNGESSRTNESPSASPSSPPPPPPTGNGMVGNESDDAEEGESSRYRLPTGGWFEYTSCPHYLTEILIYLSFVVVLHHHGGGGGGIGALPPLCSGPGGFRWATAGSGWWRGLSSSSGLLSEESLSSSPVEFKLINVLRLVLGEWAWELLNRLSLYKSLSLLLWVVTNLSISASRTHAFYLRRFGGGSGGDGSGKSSGTGDGRGRGGQSDDAARQVERRAALIPFIW